MKIRLCCIACLMVLAASSVAATTYTVTIPSGYSTIANYLDHGGNTLAEVVPNVPDGTMILKWNCVTWVNYTFDSLFGGWFDAGFNPAGNVTLAPGEGAMIYNPGQSFVLTFSGNPRLPVPIVLPCPCGTYSLLSSQTNAVATFEGIVGVPPPDGAQLLRWITNAWTTYTYDSVMGGWLPSEPIINAGESVLIFFPCAGCLRLNCAPNKTVECGPQWDFDQPGVVDVCCTNVTVTAESTVVSGTYPLRVTRRWKAVDCKNNIAYCSQTLTLDDTKGVKYVQPPNLTNGVDVFASHTRVLADDFVCTNTGPVTDIHLWCSWNADYVDPQMPVWLGIYDDVPATNGLPSHPGQLKWQQWFAPGEYLRGFYTTGSEDFYDPNNGVRMGADTNMYYYCFYPTNVFQQQGTPREPKIYWLAAYGLTGTNHMFGWKTSILQQNDAAVWTLWPSGPPLGDWKPIYNPPGTAPLDLAFKITTTPTNQCQCPEPTLACSNLVVECGSPVDPPFAWDNCCRTNLTPKLLWSVTNGPCPWVVTETWQAVDCCGQTNKCNRTVMLVDTTPPVITCASNKTVVYGSAWKFDPPTAWDTCCGTNVTVSLLSTITNGRCPQIIISTWLATDCCGLSNVCNQTITVDTATTATGPYNQTICAGSNVTFSTTAGGMGPFTYQWSKNGVAIPGATDNALTLGPVTMMDSGSEYCVRVTGACNSVINCAKLTVDTAPPVIICATNKTVPCGAAWSFDLPSAYDAYCGTNVTIRVVSTVTNGVGCSQVITRTWEATDCCGNSSRCSQTVTFLLIVTPVDVTEYIRTNIRGGSLEGVTLWMTPTALDQTHVARDLDPEVPDLVFPPGRWWLVMVDCLPRANFGHPVAWLFVRDDLSGHTDPVARQFPPTVWAGGGTGPEVAFRCVGVTPQLCPDLFVVAPTNFVPYFHPAKDCLRAVLISGGIRASANYTRYADNLRSMYKKLRHCGFRPENIFVYYADGTALDLDNDDHDANDNTGNDVTGAANKAFIRQRITGLNQGNGNLLFIYGSNHGSCGKGLCLWDLNNNGKLDTGEIYTPTEFADDTRNSSGSAGRVFALFDQCYSGQFTSVASDGSHQNMAIYTSAAACEVSWGRDYMSFWEQLDPANFTMNALHSYVDQQIPKTAYWRCSDGNFVYLSQVCSCDVNNPCQSGCTSGRYCCNLQSLGDPNAQPPIPYEGGSTPTMAEGTPGLGDAKLSDCPELRLSIAAFQQSVILSITTLRGWMFYVEYADTLGPPEGPNWRILETLIGTGERVEVTDSIRPGQRFYRVRQVPQVIRQLAPGSGVEVMQVDFLSPSNHFVSNWGRVEVNPGTLARSTGIEAGYINVVSSNGWAVLNLPVPPTNQPSLATYFDLSLGQSNLPIQNIDLKVLHSLGPIGEVSTVVSNLDFVAYSVPGWKWDAQGVGPWGEFVPGPPPALIPIHQVVPLVAWFWSSYQTVENAQTAYMQCVPMSMANSLQFHEDMHLLTVPHNHILGLKGDNSLVGQLDTACNRYAPSRTVGDGLWFVLMVDGKFKYLQDNSLTGILTHRHQGRGWGSTGQRLPDGNYTSNGSTSQDDGTTITWNWISGRIRDGCDVEAVFSYDSGGGHAVRITGCGMSLGKPWLRYSHDCLQTNNDPNDNQGLENVLVWLADDDNDGYLNFGSWSRELKFVFAECP